MNFTNFQKFISSILIFSLLFSFTVRVPFLSFLSGVTYAEEEKFYNLISVIVDEEIYNDVKSKLIRYTQDVQSVLENTRVVILPTPSTATSFDIASLNEKLFFEGYKGVKNVNFESKLIGTVLVGDIPIPVVFDGEKSSRSVVPYTDFQEKSYVFHHEEQRYLVHDGGADEIIPEIWHGIISPNSGDEDQDIELIKGYFDKNHDFYKGQGNFQKEANIINGKLSDEVLDTYEPYVFYYDQFRETQALSYEKYSGYTAYLQNQEDIVYNRYTRELAQKVKDQVLGVQNENLRDLIEKAIPSFPTDQLSTGPDIQYTPDVQTRYITDNATNKFLEIFNEGTLGDIRKYIHNAGRYNGQGSEVNVDMIPFLISVLDQVSEQVVKNINNRLEEDIDNIVKNGLSRDIAIPLSFVDNTGAQGVGNSCKAEFRNFYFGLEASKVQSAKDCSIYRGSVDNEGKLVEANRGLNIKLSQPDLNLCGSQVRTNSSGKITAGIQGYWGGNTPINLNKESLGDALFELDSHDLKGGIRPVFDITGAFKREEESLEPSPLDCYDLNFVQTLNMVWETRGSGEDQEQVCVTQFQAPVEGQSRQGTWNCNTVNNRISYTSSFESLYPLYRSGNSTGTCTTKNLSLGNQTWTQPLYETCSGGEDGGCSCDAGRFVENYTYKKIPSYIEHKSPTNQEFGAQINALTTPDLPVDKDRYIDFIAANGIYQKIQYPYLFRVAQQSGQELTLENIDTALKNHLDQVSSEINSVISSSTPNGLSGAQQEIYNLLKTGAYPAANVNLYNTLKSEPLQTYTIDGDTKEISYYDTLVFAIYWNNLKTVSGKYKFVFENYLSDQFGGSDYLFQLPKNKKSYEIAYLGAPGDSQNMYIKLDPEEKGTNPYAAIISRNIALNTSILGANVNPSPVHDYEGVFECAPPDGVPIWEWIPAVICRLQSLLPPTIGISEGSCGPSLLSEEEQEEIAQCQGDVDKNGINDCIEGKLEGGSLELVSDAEKYYYSSVGTLGAILRDSSGAVVTLDNISYVDFKLERVEIPDDPLEEFAAGNIQVVYDADDVNLSNDEQYAEAQKYVNFRDTRSRVAQGKTNSYFSVKRKDANIVFSARLQALDNNGVSQIDLQSGDLRIEVRGDRLFLNSYLVEGTETTDVSAAVNTLKVSDLDNVFLIDTNKKYVEDVSSQIFAQNTNPEKVILALTNYSKNGNILSVDYPISFQIFREDELIYEETDIAESELENFKILGAIQQSGRLNFVIKDSSGYIANKTIDFLPEVAENIEVELGTTISQIDGNLTTHILKFTDRFGNITSGDMYEVDMSINGGGLVFYDTKSSNFSTRTIEGYKIFRTESTNTVSTNTLNFELKDISGNTLVSESSQIRTIEGIDMEITPTSTEIKVGGDIYDFDIVLKDLSGNILTDFDSRAYMVINPIYGSTPQSYVYIQDGQAQMQLRTKTVASRDVKLEFQVEGMSSIVQETIDILPEVPLKLDLSLSRDKIEASSEDETTLYVILKDRYGNEVFTDDSTQFDLEILPEYQNIITSDVTTKVSQEGKTEFKIQGTNIPGIGYFKVSTNPSLEENYFVMNGQAPFLKDDLVIPTMKNASGLTDTGKLFFKEYNSSTYISKFTTLYLLENSESYGELPSVLQQQVSDFWRETNQLVVYGVGENAGSIETFYFWNDEHINGSKYNGIYSVLLGAPYGDITQENYLAGSLLFDADNRSLAVTSILNNPYKYSDILSLSNTGNIKNIFSGRDITQDIRLRPDFDTDKRLYVDIFNDALGTYVGKAYYNLGETQLILCDVSLGTCLQDNQEETSTIISLLDNSYSLEQTSDSVVLKNSYGSEMIVFSEDGTIERKSNLYFEIDDNNSLGHLGLLVKSGEDVIAQVAVSLQEGSVNITRDEVILQNKLQTLDNTLIVYLKTNQYGTRDIFEKNGTTRKIIFYNDPFASRYVLDEFHSSHNEGIENFYQEKGIGWEGYNKSLLAFSSGESVGESTKKYASFSLVNLGDPVISLKKIQRTFSSAPSLEKSFDPTIGTLISGKENLVGYQVFDYNNDQKDDVLLIKTDGYIELLENKDIDGNYLQKGDLVFAVDGGPVRLVKTGDFTGDNYDDIFFVSNDGEPVLFNNQVKDFVRVSLEEQFSLSGSIIQAEVYDMDNDTKDDIVTLDDSGQIHIFYGGGLSTEPEFTQLFIGDGYGIKLSDTVLSRGGAVYFDELPQIDDEVNLEDMITSNEEFQAALEEAIETSGDGTGTSEPEGEFFNEYLADRLLFIKLPYSPYRYDFSLTEEENLINSIDASIETTNYEELDVYLDQSEEALSNFIQENSSYINFNSSYGQSQMTYFLRSEYADTQGLVIEKTFTDTTPEFLQSGDLVNVEVSLKNTSSQTLNNIAFVDTLSRNFTLDSEEITVISQEDKTIPIKPGIGMFDILVDGFFLAPGEEVVLQYTLKTLPLKYGYIQVGLFEEGELGDDEWGDIILKPNHLNCGEEADIYRSIAQRDYDKGKTTPVCEEDKLKLPDDIAQNALDENGNGVPDYIDDLVGGSQEDIMDYAQEILNDMQTDTDNDGVPDADDPLPNINENGADLMSAISEINGAIDEISDEIDNLIQGFSCGFGGGSCISMPLNWAPLAPGGDPTLFGFPIGDGLKVNEGIPVFSALTGLQMTCGLSPCCIPTVYPVSPLGFVAGPACGSTSAGGYLGTWAPTNYVRLFATPTLTGAAGIAACYGGPAIVRGNIPPPGVHPIAPGGNCIVAAVPLFGCNGDEGDPRVTGYPWNYPQYGVINANCPSGVKDSQKIPEEIDNDFVEEYLEYKETGVKTQSLIDKFKDAFSQVAEGGGNWVIPSGPLINISGGGDSDMSLTVDLDPSALSSGSFQDVVKVQNTRIGAFPDFLMDWVTRQIEEVVNKLTNLPKVFVILPDFSGVFDYGWEDFGENFQASFQAGKQERSEERQELESRIMSLRNQKAGLDCAGEQSGQCSIIDRQIRQLQQQRNLGNPAALSGIRAAYEFLGNVPLVNVEPEIINVNIPWVDQTSIERAAHDWQYTVDQWKKELQRAAAAWSFGQTCNHSNPVDQAACESHNQASQKLYLDANKLIGSLERNLEIIEEYKRIPEKINKLINIKEVRLEQILCNIEAISSLLGEWIDTNGERFKAWVELFILIKAILKSWQLLIDVFKGYDEECHQCKNERQDLQTFIWRLISAVIPRLPIIQFPKWPDIILDLHNVRAGINLYLPDFEINLRPIVLPTLPQLKLPDVPYIGLELPELPILPEITIPELPELPSLPTIELPDLPPPPKIPKLFGAVEGLLNIMKLVTKIMCIIKQSPFVPEWRAGDQIAYITERGGYLSFDFIDITMPQFSYPFVDAIKVTTYVNFEFETEFIVEAVRQITTPLNTFTNDISNMFKIQIPDIDFSGVVPESIEADLDGGGLDIEVDGEDLSSFNNTEEGFAMIALLLAQKIQQAILYVDSQKDIVLTNKEFIAYVNENLASSVVTEDPRMQEMLDVWEHVGNLTYSKEDALIQALQENREDKFDELKNILSTELQKTKELKEALKNIGSPDYFTKVAFENTSDVDSYNQRLSSYNEKFVNSAINLVEGDAEYEAYQADIQQTGQSIINQVNDGIGSYTERFSDTSKTTSSAPVLYAAETGDATETGEVNSCSYSGEEYEYTYEGLYILEYDRHYRLFEYLDELRGDEYTTPTDIDGDGDDDLLYMMNNQLFLKENLKNDDTKEFVSLPPLVLTSDDNMFYNGDIYYESVNGFDEASVSDGYLNVRFDTPTNPEVDNFRMEFYTIVDKFRNLGDEAYIPTGIKKFIVDAVADIEDHTIIEENESYTLGKHTAYISQAGVVPGAKLTNTKLLNIRDDLLENNLVTLTSGSKLSAGNASFTIEYYTDSPDDTAELTVPKNSYVAFEQLTYIIGLSGDAYVESTILEDIEGAAIVGHIGKPLFPGAKITYSGNDATLTEASHIEVTHADGSRVDMHMRDVYEYRLYDLGVATDHHLIRLKVDNDFYYAKMYAFKEGISGTYTHQILLSPQTQADTEPPQIGLNQKIRIPVYQKRTVDFTPYIYEDSGIDNIVDVRVDFDLAVDSDGDGDLRNDADTDAINILQTPTSIKVEFGEYETLFEKEIRFMLTDGNGNIGYKDIDFEVYPPAPQIYDYEDDTLKGVINETLLDEPVRIYRLRGGAIKKLENTEGTDLVETLSDGNYNFGVPETSRGLRLKKDDIDVAYIDEYTGKITLENLGATVSILASNDPDNAEGFPRIAIDFAGEELFYEYIQPQYDPEIDIITSPDEITEPGIYIRILDQELYNSFTVPTGVAFNPGAVILYLASDEEKTPIFSVFRDGRVYSGDLDRYTLRYQALGDRSTYILYDTLSQTEIAQVILDIEASYILK